MHEWQVLWPLSWVAPPLLEQPKAPFQGAPA